MGGRARCIATGVTYRRAMTNFAGRYGPWAVIAGGSDGTGAAFAEELVRRGVGVVLVARRPAVLEALADRLDGETLVVPLDLSRDDAAPGAGEGDARDLEVGTFVYNVGADSPQHPLPGDARPKTGWRWLDAIATR